MEVLSQFLERRGGFGVIDGGLATQLEVRGADLNDPLWSAKCLIHSPDLIRQVHQEYLQAGAEILISASYQATIQGFESRGLSTRDAEMLLQRSVQLACEARHQFWKSLVEISNGSLSYEEISMKRPILVAASVGSYGAYLANGSEYSGDYGCDMTIGSLKDFHRRRVEVLAESGADLIAFETIPNKMEARAYVELLEENEIQSPAWLSFNSKDGVNTVYGDSIKECAMLADSCKKVIAVGVNCTPPRFIHGLILAIKNVTSKPILAYPNSGETYDADLKKWVPSTGASDDDFVSYVKTWQESGASLLGGCCRTTPNTIKKICNSFNKNFQNSNQQLT